MAVKYKLAVMSDSHGKAYNIENALPAINECDYFVYLGDGNRDVDKLLDKITARVVRVRGNCDLCGDLQQETVLKVGESDFFITHGNLYGAKRGLLGLALRAQELNCQFVLYGHTHEKRIDIYNGITLINPGCASGYSPSYAVVSGDGILFNTEFYSL